MSGWALGFAIALAGDPGFSERGSCDIPSSVPAPTAEASDVDSCEAACAVDADCAAYVFVSGWNRCTLQRATSPRVTLHLVAAAVAAADGARTLPAPTRDHDHKGKDLETAPRDLPNAAACAEACLGEESCRGYVYIEGYRSCWLKATDGELVPKTFTCAVRTSSVGEPPGAAPPKP